MLAFLCPVMPRTLCAVLFPLSASVVNRDLTIWHRKRDSYYSCNGAARIASRIMSDTLHSMAIDLTPCHDKPWHWLGMRVDSLSSHSKGDPCVCWVTNPPEWKMGKRQLWQPSNIQKSQMESDRASAVFQAAGSTQQPLFGVELQPAFF